MSVATHSTNDSVAAAPQRADKKLLIVACGVLIVAIIAAYRETIVGMISIWWRSETFNHCFLIVPLAAYVAYTRRALLRSVETKPYPPGLALLAFTGLVWLAGWSASAEVVEQFAVVAMIPAVVLIAFGPRLTWSLAGPLAYLFFAVPFGEIFMDPLREFTASSIMTGLHLTGIGVVRSGLQLSTAAGDFAVERACSGLRYLIASFALGSLFAMLYLKTWQRRLFFVGIS